MKPRGLVIGAILVVVSFLCGVLFSDRVRGPTAPGDDRSDGRDAADGGKAATRGDTVAASESSRGVSRPRAQRGEIERLREELAQRDALIAQLRGDLGDTDLGDTDLGDTKRRDANSDPDNGDPPDSEMTAERRRQMRWERIQAALSGVMSELVALEDQQTDGLQLGDHLAARLAKVTPEQFAEIVAFDADATDPDILGPIRAVMTQALIHAPAAAPVRDAFMARLLDRPTRHARADAGVRAHEPGCVDSSRRPRGARVTSIN